eukprot:comp21900_c0_seq2/m.31404 comp21900_c0_seq2/g.31404  ORF comp21900_c0_seq2/g.31404 comp21900_c0_seq2/m.31404 type:complete len:252 (-) comp21900_c0_seq2:1939-2694(-)
MSLLQQRRFPGGTLGRQMSAPKDYDNTGGLKRAKSLSKKLTHSTSASLTDQSPLAPLVEGLVPPQTPRIRTSKGENVFLDLASSFMRRSKPDASPRTHSAQAKANPLYISVTDARPMISIGTPGDMEALPSSSSSAASRSTTEHQLWYSDDAAQHIECTLQGLGLRRVLFDALITRLRSSHTLWLPDPVELAESIACGGFWSLEELDRDGMPVEPKVVEVNRLVREFNVPFGLLGVEMKACNNCLWFVHTA